MFIHLQAANCNSRLVVNEIDLKMVENEKKVLLLLNTSTNIFVLKPVVFRKLSQFPGMQNDALMHVEGLKG